MDFPMNSKTPHFNYDEVVEIYRKTNHPTERKLRDTARNLFPGRDPIAYENLFCLLGHGALSCTMETTRNRNWF